MNGGSYYHAERVIVIGAGISGLACARELQHRGYAVLVIEARSRVGGRLKAGNLSLPPTSHKPTPSKSTSSAKSSPKKRRQQPHQQQQLVDLGGALIHGVEDNPLTTLVQDLGLATQPLEDCLLFQNGWPVDPRDDARISAQFNDCLEETFERCQHSEPPPAASSSPPPSFGQLFHQVCSERSVNASSPVFLWHKANLEVSCGASFEELGWKWNEDEPYGYDGDHVALPQTWKSVVDCLAEDLDILYDTPVQRIHVVQPAPPPPAAPLPPNSVTDVPTSRAPPNGSAASERRLRGPIMGASTTTRKSRRLLQVDAFARRSVRPNLGQGVDRFTVDALSSSTAKRRRKSVQEKGLPRPKKTVVQVELNNGTILDANHVVCTLPLAILKSGTILFEPPLPPAKQQAIQRLGAGLLNKCALSFPHVFWQESDFMGLAEPDRSFLVLNVHAFTGQPVLAFWFGGAQAREIEDWTDQSIVAECLLVLRRITGRHIPEPVDYCVTRWGREEFSKMAFTYVPPGVNGYEELQAMSEPVYDSAGIKPSLMFAGEHTTPFHPSTMHGAFLSGIREAYRLDLTLYPQANENMEFSSTELYQRTFAVKRRFFGVKSIPRQVKAVPNTVQPPSNRRQHRRRGAATVMKLRKRADAPKQVGASLPLSLSTGPSLILPSRKSPRVTMLSQTTGFSSPRAQLENGATRVEPSAFDVQSHEMSFDELHALEDAALMRGIESYGADYGYMLETILPVYGSYHIATLAQLRKRCHQLLSTLRSAKSSSATSRKRWVAKVVYPPEELSDSAGGNESGSRAMKTHSLPSREAQSTSNDDLTQPIVQTKFGRHVKKPDMLRI